MWIKFSIKTVQIKAITVVLVLPFKSVSSRNICLILSSYFSQKTHPYLTSFVRVSVMMNFTITAKFSRAHWLIFIVNKSTDNKNDVRCSARAFSSESEANYARNLSLLL